MAQLVLCLSKFFGLAVCFVVAPLNAALMTFNVDLSGVDPVTENRLRVYGELSVSPTPPIIILSSDTNVRSKLYIQRNSEAPILLPNVANITTAPTTEITQMRWRIQDNNLYLVRTGNESERFGWGASSAPTFFTFGAGQNPHIIAYFPTNSRSDNVLLRNSGPADGPFGFLVGTSIPEPSSILLMIGSGAMVTRLRRRIA